MATATPIVVNAQPPRPAPSITTRTLPEWVFIAGQGWSVFDRKAGLRISENRRLCHAERTKLYGDMSLMSIKDPNRDKAGAYYTSCELIYDKQMRALGTKALLLVGGGLTTIGLGIYLATRKKR